MSKKFGRLAGDLTLFDHTFKRINSNVVTFYCKNSGLFTSYLLVHIAGSLMQSDAAFCCHSCSSATADDYDPCHRNNQRFWDTIGTERNSDNQNFNICLVV